jgi:VanZ family protein
MNGKEDQIWPSRGMRWLAWFIYAAGWSAALVTPQPAIFAQEVLPKEALFPAAKSLHVLAYLGLTVLTGWLRVPWRWRGWAFAFLPFHAAATECIQLFVPHRGGSLTDVGIDCFGIALGLLVSWRWWRAPPLP